eukprot:gene7983-8840_t
MEESKGKMSKNQITVYTKLFFNGMIHDLTSMQIKPQDNIGIEPVIQNIEDNFDFVMIAEYFDEGIVLLRKILGWNYLDLVYESKNTRRAKHTELITSEVKKKILQLNKADSLLYEHFKNVMIKKIKEYGASFERHLEIFKELNMEINSQCRKSEYSLINIENLKDTMDEIDINSNEKELIGNLHSISNCFCVKLHKSEAEYVKYFQTKFQPYYHLQENYVYQERC